MNAEKLQIEVAAKLTIPDETVERCLHLIEMWLNDNPGKRIFGGYWSGGKVLPFRIENREDLE